MNPTEVVEIVSNMTDEEFQKQAPGILGRELGAYGLARFLRLYRSGSGDYTRDRHRWLDGLSVKDAMAQL